MVATSLRSKTYQRFRRVNGVEIAVSIKGMDKVKCLFLNLSPFD